MWAHVLLCSVDAESRRLDEQRFHGVTAICALACVHVSVCRPSVCLFVLEAKGNRKPSEPQINFLFIVAEWRLEMHGLL